MSHKINKQPKKGLRKGAASATLAVLFASAFPAVAHADTNDTPQLLDLDHDEKNYALTGTVDSPNATVVVTYRSTGEIYYSVEADGDGHFDINIPEGVDPDDLAIQIIDVAGEKEPYFRDNINPSEDYSAPEVVTNEMRLFSNTSIDEEPPVVFSKPAYLVVSVNGQRVYDSQEEGEDKANEHQLTSEKLGGDLPNNGVVAVQAKDDSGNHSATMNWGVQPAIEAEATLEIGQENEDGDQVIPYKGSTTEVSYVAPKGTEISYQGSWMDDEAVYTVEGYNDDEDIVSGSFYLGDNTPEWEDGLSVNFTATFPGGETSSINNIPLVESAWELAPPLPDTSSLPENALLIGGQSSGNEQIQLKLNGQKVPDAVTSTDNRGYFNLPLEDVSLNEGDKLTLVTFNENLNLESADSIEIDVLEDSGISSAPDNPAPQWATGQMALVEINKDNSLLILIKDDQGNVLSRGLSKEADDDGLLHVGLPNLDDGQEITFYARNVEGNESSGSSMTVEAQNPPELQTDTDFVDADNLDIVGETSPHADVIALNDESEEIARTEADDNGQFLLSIPGDHPILGESGTFNIYARTQFGSSDPVMITVDGPENSYNAPEVESPFEDGVITGTTEPGFTVKITDSDDDFVTEGEADDQGNFSIPVDLGDFDETEILYVTAYDELDNASPTAEAIVADVTAPTGTIEELPAGQQFLEIQADPDPSGVNIEVLGPDGDTLDSVDDLGGELKFTAVIPGFSAGEELTVIFSDNAGNSREETIEVQPDDSSDLRVNVSPLAEGSESLSGTSSGGEAETAHATVNGKDYSADVDNDEFTFNFDDPVEVGDDISVWVEDEFGAESSKVDVEVVADELATPRVDYVGDTSAKITGTAPGDADKVRLYDEDDDLLDEVSPGNNGRFTFDTGPLEPGTVFFVASVSSHGDEGPRAKITVGQDSAPTLDVNPVDVGDTEITGETSPDAIVTVTDDEDDRLGRTTADSEGFFTVPINRPTESGEFLSIVASNSSGSRSDVEKIEIGDEIPPEAPTVYPLSNFSGFITGNTESEATITASVEGEEIGESTAEGDGEFSIELENRLTAGIMVEVVATDSAGNTSDSTSVKVTDEALPELNVNAIEYGDTGISGTSEEGNEIRLLDGKKQPVADTLAKSDGTFSFKDVPDMNFEARFFVQAISESGNVEEEEVQVLDTIPPVINGNSISYKPGVISGEVSEQATIKAYTESGQLVASMSTANDGKFSLTTGELVAGTTLFLVATDRGDNQSEQVKVTVPEGEEEELAAETLNDPNPNIPGENDNSEDEDGDEDGDDGDDGDDGAPVWEIDEDGNVVPVSDSAQNLEQTGSDAALVGGAGLLLITLGGVIYTARRRSDSQA